MTERNPILQSLFDRKSVRVYEEKPIPAEMKQAILEAAAQAPSAGCQQLYTILDITDPALKEALAESCDHQPFIAKAPLVLVFCADCGAKLYFCTCKSYKDDSQNHFVCSNYKSNTGSCKIHYIREQVLYRIVLETIRQTLSYVRMFRKDFKLEMLAQDEESRKAELAEKQKALSGAKKRMEDLDRIIQHIYEDNVLGRVTNEQKELAATIPEKKERLERLKSSMANVDAFIEKARRYTEIDELTPELLRLFIQRIEIGERSKKHSRSAGQNVRIVYRDIGRVDSPMQEGEHAPHITKQITDIEEIKRLLA